MSIPKALQNTLSLPVISAPMFIVSGPELVIAQCKAGIVGSFPALNARPQSLLGEWLTTILTELDAYQAANPSAIVSPYAVNLIVHKSNDRLEDDVNTCIEFKVPIIITSLRALDPDLVERIHAYGGIIFHDVINVRHAQKAIEVGVDGLVLVCAGAGGHAGTLSPFALVSEIKQLLTVLLYCQHKH
ncbi:MAG: nitronate monooxygenase [Congregibacter sp.]|jgi:nitronate monooxygenase